MPGRLRSKATTFGRTGGKKNEKGKSRKEASYKSQISGVNGPDSHGPLPIDFVSVHVVSYSRVQCKAFTLYRMKKFISFPAENKLREER